MSIIQNLETKVMEVEKEKMEIKTQFAKTTSTNFKKGTNNDDEIKLLK